MYERPSAGGPHQILTGALVHNLPGCCLFSQTALYFVVYAAFLQTRLMTDLHDRFGLDDKRPAVSGGTTKLEEDGTEDDVSLRSSSAHASALDLTDATIVSKLSLQGKFVAYKVRFGP